MERELERAAELVRSDYVIIGLRELLERALRAACGAAMCARGSDMRAG